LNRIVSVCLLALALAAACAVQGLCEGKKINLLAEISSIKGQVEILGKGETDRKPAEEGLLAGEGDTIITGQDGSCVITWASGRNTLSLGPLSRLEIDTLENTPSKNMDDSVLRLYRGRASIRAEKMSMSESLLEVKTPTAIAGVRGTKFTVVILEDGTTEVSCYDGELAVQGVSGGEVTVSAGQKVRVAPSGKPGRPEKISDEEISNFKKDKAVNQPSLQILQPLGNVETYESTMTVYGKTDPGAGVEIDGKDAPTDSTGVFSSPVSLADGKNTITIQATGEDALSTTKSLTITYKPGAQKPGEAAGGEESSEEAEAAEVAGDKTGKEIELSIAYPPDGFLTRKSVVSIVGKKSPGTKISINGEEIDVSPGSPSFIHELKLEKEGENPVVVTAARGVHIKKVSMKVIVDTTPPMLEVVRPTGQFSVYSGDCTLQGNTTWCNIIGFTEPDAILTINKMRQNVGDNGDFNVIVPLGTNEATLIVAAEDPAGNRTTKILTRIIDPDLVKEITLSVSPQTIYSNNRDTATVTVSSRNVFGQGVDGAGVYLTFQVSATETIPSSLSNPVITLGSDGIGTATFYAGLGPEFTTYTATITATVTTQDGTLSDTETITLLFDGAPMPND